MAMQEVFPQDVIGPLVNLLLFESVVRTDQGPMHLQEPTQDILHHQQMASGRLSTLEMLQGHDEPMTLQ